MLPPTFQSLHPWCPSTRPPLHTIQPPHTPTPYIPPPSVYQSPSSTPKLVRYFNQSSPSTNAFHHHSPHSLHLYSRYSPSIFPTLTPLLASTHPNLFSTSLLSSPFPNPLPIPPLHPTLRSLFPYQPYPPSTTDLHTTLTLLSPPVPKVVKYVAYFINVRHTNTYFSRLSGIFQSLRNMICRSSSPACTFVHARHTTTDDRRVVYWFVHQMVYLRILQIRLSQEIRAYSDKI